MEEDEFTQVRNLWQDRYGLRPASGSASLDFAVVRDLPLEEALQTLDAMWLRDEPGYVPSGPEIRRAWVERSLPLRPPAEIGDLARDTAIRLRRELGATRAEVELPRRLEEADPVAAAAVLWFGRVPREADLAEERWARACQRAVEVARQQLLDRVIDAGHSLKAAA